MYTIKNQLDWIFLIDNFSLNYVTPNYLIIRFKIFKLLLFNNLALRNYRFLNIGSGNVANLSVYGAFSGSGVEADLKYFNKTSLAAKMGTSHVDGHGLVFDWDTRYLCQLKQKQYPCHVLLLHSNNENKLYSSWNNPF